ncbi:NAD(P)/FAD-dependent oxidoreductase [Luteimicrobium subarcticum]|uniref:NAD/ferredoxin-dependent reductase-like protein n=1 Tax=Luteimicrobium subarcticum TaxID=620910 RepID=A0A2M8WV55_9MICO|nr:FAD-dependent oxidoreductase [Luteimicrobium subarcticum]PJI94804.1 NAD/ferredoxin-dependent reductase-like protein [Luteimicrobium subarcticum]
MTASPAPAPPADRPDVRSVVVVGAGLAGAQTVAALRSRGFDGRVTVLGAEDRAPYDRPPLSKELFTRDAPADLSAELGVDLAALADDVRLGTRATGLVLGGADAPRIVTDTGDDVAADAVVLAVGSRPVVPPGWDDALLLHTWDDAVALRRELVEDARLVVVGAGWIGAEVAGAAAARGVDVVVVEAGATPLERQLGAEVGRHLTPWYGDAGVALELEAPAVRVGRHQVALADGRLLAGDVVLAAVGARPATDWLRGTLTADARGSLRGDADGRVAPGVWAVGDCVTRHGTPFGDVVGGHWSAALQDPDRVVGALLEDVAASAVPSQHAPYVFSTQLGHDLAVLGVPSPDHEVVLRGSPTSGGPWSALYLERDSARLAAVLVADAHREVPVARKVLRDGPVLVDVAVASDPSRRLRDAVRS